MIKVYIAGPYTKGDVAQNVQRAIITGDVLADAGFWPYIPHLTHFWHLITPRPYEFWLEYDSVMIDVCDILLRLDGESSGADKEVKMAEKQGKRIYYSIENLIKSERILSNEN